MIPRNVPQKQCSIFSLSLDYYPHVYHKDYLPRSEQKIPCPTSEILTFIGLLDIASEVSEKQNKKVLLSLKKQR